MPARNELDLLTANRPAILDHATEIIDGAETERILRRILDSNPPGSLATAPTRRVIGAHRRLRHVGFGVAAGALMAVVALVGATLLAGPTAPTHPAQASHAGHPSLRWRLVGDVSGPWHPLGTVQPNANFQMQCASTTTCYALGSKIDGSDPGQLLVTTDGGHSWSDVNLPAQLGTHSSMSCVDASTCGILGVETSGQAVFLETSDGGQTWSSHPGPSQLDSDGYRDPSVQAIGALDCTSATRCTAVGSPQGLAASSSFTTSDGGVTWSGSTTPVTVEIAGGLNTSSLQCLSDGTCIVAGFVPGSLGESLAVGYSTDGGASWQSASVPTGTYGIPSISCPAANDCLMVSFGGGTGTSTILHSTDGGQSWSLVSSSGLPQSQLTGLSCSSSDDCWTSGGTTQPSFPAGDSGSMLAVSTDQGQTWQQAILPAGISAVQGVSCPSMNNCYALALQSQSGKISYVFLSNSSN